MRSRDVRAEKHDNLLDGNLFIYVPLETKTTIVRASTSVDSSITNIVVKKSCSRGVCCCSITCSLVCCSPRAQLARCLAVARALHPDTVITAFAHPALVLVFVPSLWKRKKKKRLFMYISGKCLVVMIPPCCPRGRIQQTVIPPPTPTLSTERCRFYF